MDVAIDPVVAPELTAMAALYLGLGVTLGTCSGLTPGIHANNFALLLAGVAPAMPGQPLFVGIAMLAAGVVHTFLDAIPALAIGVPGPEMAVAALPGHRLVLEGRGREALRLSAIGSMLAVVLAIPLAIPITLAMVRWYPVLQRHMPLVLGGVAAVLILSEPSRRSVVAAALSFALSSGLGFLVLDLEPAAPLDAGGVLAPLFAGLFGAPVLIDAMGGDGVPPQGDARLRTRRRDVLVPASAGSVSGAIVGYLPGVSSAIAAVIALLSVPNEDPDRGFVVATSGVDTANTIFALFALVALGTPRTGVLVAVDQAGVPINLAVMVGTVAAAAAASFILLLLIGDWYLTSVGRVNYALVCGGILTLLALLSWLFAGLVGVGILGVSTLLGYVPVRGGCKRVHLMGVLMGPIMAATWQYPVPFV